MPGGIETETQTIETCPAPEFKLVDKDIEQFVEELDDYARLFVPAFSHRAIQQDLVVETKPEIVSGVVVKVLKTIT